MRIFKLLNSRHEHIQLSAGDLAHTGHLLGAPGELSILPLQLGLFALQATQPRLQLHIVGLLAGTIGQRLQDFLGLVKNVHASYLSRQRFTPTGYQDLVLYFR